jgi:hypothetical protein
MWYKRRMNELTPMPAQNAEPARFPLIAFSVGDLDGMVERLRAHQVVLPSD